MRKGRFQKAVSETAQRYSESVSFDWRLYRHDIAGSIAHAAALARAGILSEAERHQIGKELHAIEKEIADKKFKWDRSLEDVHMNIEAALTKRIGAAGGKLHTARSRNDQIALDLRLFVKAEIGEVRNRVRSLQTTLLDAAEQNVDVIMPGYTHLQRAQPVLLAHYLLGQIEALERDVGRLNDCFARADVLPLGSGALAGSTIVLDREFVARQLGFSQVSQNSLDAVSDRDFVCDFLYALAIISMHLSRLGEDVILWNTVEFGFIELSESFATGSSLMPQKKNPDMAELTRGKTGRVYGNLFSLLTMLKGLPSSYNRDLQEDKQPLFDSVDTVCAGIEVFAGMIAEMKFDRERLEAAASDPTLLATDLAEYLVKKGMPFREAHEVVGRIVATSNVPLDQIPLAKWKKASPFFAADVAKIFNVRRSIESRTATGAPSPKNVRAQIARWRKLFG
jgi:argininosuccinate lyase